MKKNTLLINVIVILCCFTGANGQDVLFFEDFESSPISSFVHAPFVFGEPIEGIGACGLYSLSNAIELMSTDVDLRNDQNSSNFLGVNPQNPCGGVTDGFAEGIFNFEAATGFLQMQFDYIVTNTLWGFPMLEIKLINPLGEEYIINSQLIERNTWTSVIFDLPETMKSDNIEIFISSSSTGEAVGIDNIKIIDSPTLGVEEIIIDNNNKAAVYPIPSNDQITITSLKEEIEFVTIYTLRGKKIASFKEMTSDEIDISSLESGVYLLSINLKNGNIQTKRIVKE